MPTASENFREPELENSKKILEQFATIMQLRSSSLHLSAAAIFTRNAVHIAKIPAAD
jgi:hypothetical protein